MDRSLLAAALCFWSLATNTMNLRFGMMTPTVLDMAALFGLSPLGVEVNADLIAPEAEGSFKAAWPTVAKLAGSKAKNMLNYSSFYGNFGVEDNADDDSISPLGEFWLQAYFPELRGAVNIADTEPLANSFTRAPKKHNASTSCYKFFYELTERTRSQFRVCLARPYPLFLTHDLSIIPDGETENDLREIWGSFLVARDLHCGLSKPGDEVYLPHCVARQFGLIETPPLPPLSLNRLSSWRADVSHQHGVAGISFQLQKGMTFLTLRPWMRRNAVNEDGRLWYEECTSARFIRPVEEAVRVALKNTDWDLLTPKTSKVKKVLASPSRPSTPVAVVPRVATSPSAPRVATLPSARPAAAALPAASTPRAPIVTGARKTLAHRTVPSTPPA
ncbi:unnamed protein product, partial [Prunus brigantina]